MLKTLFIISILFFNFTNLSYSNETQKSVKINKTFLKDSHWNFRLKKIERINDILKISIRYSNKGAYRRPIFLAQGSTQAITSINDEGSVESNPAPNTDVPAAILKSFHSNKIFEAINIEGITIDAFTNVEKNKGKTAIFTFNIGNVEIDKAYFVSNWVTMIMRGATGVIPINILIDVPVK
ncbi:MAG: hypothetical protein CMJ14_08430 [Pelagibacterales bacterium]|nr:hypothetical protein [Pelagibacterales bacterium]|tara:strand:+ start:522 stop:1064 length:543 start_codon:yes stop_codon:yes gene_type:complete